MKNGIEIDEDGNKYWYCNGQLHREDGPAVEYVNGDKGWYIHGQLHREDGPAVEDLGCGPIWSYRGKWINCRDTKEFKRLIKLKAFW